jgi:predicted acyltransferase (DUF342 family)
MNRLFLAAVLLLCAPTPVFADSQQNRASVGDDITIPDGESAAEVACVFCSVHIHGDVSGNVAVVFGSVTLDGNHKIAGNVAVVGGNLNMGEDSEVGGNVAIVGGDTNLASDAVIHGSRTALPSQLWLLIPLAPFLILIGIIWLIVHLVRRRRYPYPVYPNGPNGRRF